MSMMSRILVGAAVTVVSAWISYRANTRWRAPARAVTEIGKAPQRAELRAGWGRPVRIPRSGVARRSNDIIVPERTGDVNVCPMNVEDVPDELPARTRFGSRAAVAAFLKEHGAAYNTMRAALIPKFVKAASAIQTCYNAEPEDAAMVYLTLHIRAHRDSATVVDASVLRMDAPAESHALIQSCVTAFKAAQLPISAQPSKGDAFLEYDDLYLKEMPVFLGPGSLAHLMSLRQAERQKQSALHSSP
jgi:hypothetical protein